MNQKLIKASKKGDIEEVKKLLAKGADADAKKKDNMWISVILWLCETITGECFGGYTLTILISVFAAFR